MRVAVFAFAAVALLSGVSAYADSMAAPKATVQEMESAPLASVEAPSPEVGLSTQLLDVQTAPQTSAPVTPTAVTPEPSSIVLMATGFISVSGMLWRRRSLSR